MYPGIFDIGVPPKETPAQVPVSSEFRLSPDQEDALSVMDNMKPGEMVFVTGKAGSGKSTLVNYYCARREGIVKLAPTGLAAQGIGGRTIHSLMGIRPEVWEVNPYSLSKRLTGVTTILVDEISMVGLKLFDFMVEKISEFSNGSVKWLFVGDFNQLPPVDDEFCTNSEHWKKVTEIELTTIHRQADPKFVAELNEVRERRMRSAEFVRLCEERSTVEFPDDAVLLTPYRKVADDYNNERIMELGRCVHTSAAGILRGKWVDNKIPQTLNYCEGAQVIMLTNDAGMRWVNGTRGIISRVSSSPASVNVLLDNGHTEQVTRVRHEILDGSGEPKLVFEQFPFQIGYAVTIHKSQGMTLDKVAVDMGGHFERGMTYVALSRCRTREGLYLLNVRR